MDTRVLLQPDADEDTIKKAYRKLALKWYAFDLNGSTGQVAMLSSDTENCFSGTQTKTQITRKRLRAGFKRCMLLIKK